ncbi:MAG: hypothetical protein BGO26_02320 [Actinobacteria bacterium 69-20]|jgi:DNA-binding XRE family transcriptional regulator|nr:helix-turn-helix domain-containing protein [Actinomycetota bacterium]OJV31300.1 MAG: hypothetical protein BGO26_02320 [Actinobacteria bacterium 69-20]
MRVTKVGRNVTVASNAADIGAMLREARRVKGLSQAELAALVGVSRQWVAGAEKGAPTARMGLMITALRCVDLLVDIVRDDSAALVGAAFGDD